MNSYLLLAIFDYVIFHSLELNISSPIKVVTLYLLKAEILSNILIPHLVISLVIKFITTRYMFYKDLTKNHMLYLITLCLFNNNYLIKWGSKKPNLLSLLYLPLFMVFIIEYKYLGILFIKDIHMYYSLQSTIFKYFKKYLPSGSILKDHQLKYIEEINTTTQFEEYLNTFNRSSTIRKNFLGRNKLSRQIFKDDYKKSIFLDIDPSGDNWTKISEIFELNEANKVKINYIIDNNLHLLQSNKFDMNSVKLVVFKILLHILDINMTESEIVNFAKYQKYILIYSFSIFDASPLTFIPILHGVFAWKKKYKNIIKNNISQDVVNVELYTKIIFDILIYAGGQGLPDGIMTAFNKQNENLDKSNHDIIVESLSDNSPVGTIIHFNEQNKMYVTELRKINSVENSIGTFFGRSTIDKKIGCPASNISVYIMKIFLDEKKSFLNYM